MALRAIAAMSLNRVIGKDGKIPWRIPEDFKWFKMMTMGHAVLMGRKTFESLGKPLPGRRNVVVSRGQDTVEGVEIVRSLEDLHPEDYPGDVWLIGGGEIYRQLLGRCDDLYLSVVQMVVDGDVFFPEFEQLFEFEKTVLREPEFEVRHYRRKESS